MWNARGALNHTLPGSTCQLVTVGKAKLEDRAGEFECFYLHCRLVCIALCLPAGLGTCSSTPTRHRAVLAFPWCSHGTRLHLVPGLAGLTVSSYAQCCPKGPGEVLWRGRKAFALLHPWCRGHFPHPQVCAPEAVGFGFGFLLRVPRCEGASTS